MPKYWRVWFPYFNSNLTDERDILHAMLCDIDSHRVRIMPGSSRDREDDFLELRHGNVSDSVSQFFRLPREVRDDIYAYAIPETEMQIVGSRDVSGVGFARGMGDPSGFYFPFRSNLGILAVNRQMRKEALRLVYRKTSIHLNDMDEFIKFALDRKNRPP
ncbi:uncharacterized protein ASPGLDRAFT_60693 [Aspergillus glaucus CBS 516.65]|uniref:Uncharacterized protein n=1 Tax=Aspergillus glaucus CBS 516.65 TaxID=1160497 RepID=A0A1L9VB06_ASPGL|nr:hypothetical protein ASPGLDRAFT_60693 [Aspergillus glaucus CBS 516.65]OJJ81012.1 hypothetical protein ASPGLDRAFT_60693 [Aspergillus glaucus CBS 516.65]